jgi:flagellar hook protein FlgE
MSFQQGLSGLSAASKNLDVIGNNVANANTVGFKQSQTQFADIFANSLSGGGGSQAGIGVKVTSISQQFGQGSVTASGNPLDIAINGGGFYRLSDQNDISYSRNGQFQTDKDGYIVNGTGLRLTGYPANTAGQINTAAPVDLQISRSDLPPGSTGQVGALVNLDGRETALNPLTFDPADPTTYNRSTSVPIYDSLGNPSTLSTYFLKTAANTWDVFATNDGTLLNGGAPVGTLNFLSTGTIDPLSTSSFAVTAPITTGAISPLAFTLGFGGTTQFGSDFGVNAISQDGYPSGHLTDFSIGPDGIIRGAYSSGKFLTLGQVALANFANSQGLEPHGNNLWKESSASGTAIVGTPGSGGLGVLQASAVEDSNVDLTAELVNMITAQRVYQANAQTIKTQDQLLQTMVNLK